MALDRAPNVLRATERLVDRDGNPTRDTLMSWQELWRQVVAGFVIVPCVASGTNAITLAPRLHKEGAANYGDHMAFAFVAAHSATAAVTAGVASRESTLALVKVYKDGGATQAGAGDIIADRLYLLLYNAALDSSTGGFVIASGGANVPAGAWTAFTPTITSGTGAITAYTATGRYLQAGKVVFVEVDITITTNGTGATFIRSTLPVTAGSANHVATGKEIVVSGNNLAGFIYASNALMDILFYNNTYPAADGAHLIVSGVYEAV